tara:strand:- start:37 stop:219 length:183 start_codon:yes stop_codon:yes gene_type:complete
VAGAVTDITQEKGLPEVMVVAALVDTPEAHQVRRLREPLILEAGAVVVVTLALVVLVELA